MTYSKNLLIIGVSVLALHACKHPNAMPSGYTHHHDTYKSPDATPAVKPATLDNQNVRLSQMDIDDAVEDLLRKITARAGVSPKPVYILTPSETGAFYNIVDSALRKNMRDLGYAISDTQAGAYAFAYSARELRKPRGSENDGYPNIELTLSVFNKVGDDARLLTEQMGNYFIAGASDQDIRPVTYSSNFSYDAPVQTHIQKAKPVQLEMIEGDPIVPEIEFKSLSSTTQDDIIVFDQEPVRSSAGKVITRPADTYGAKPVLNDKPSMVSGRVSKKIDY